MLRRSFGPRVGVRQVWGRFRGRSLAKLDLTFGSDPHECVESAHQVTY